MTTLWWDIPIGEPWPIQLLYWAVFAVVAASFLQLVVLGIAALRFAAGRGGRRRASADPDEFLWVFLVPALNEEVTIRDSVSRLQQVRAGNVAIVVVDDGSDDRTGEILAGIHDPRLHVLTRTLPDARAGKAAALNDAYEFVRAELLGGPYAHFTPERTIVGIIDADGRLGANAPRRLATHFTDPRVGGAQVLVRIYNRARPLTWMQDLEFGVFGYVIQAGRAAWGTANMGGNGQFNRLAALETVHAEHGPWRDRLTEDQDLGVRLVQNGWRSVQENRVAVHQQGVSSLRRLYRQRIRWAQGAWEAVALLKGIGRMPHALPARLDAVAYLLAPLLQVVVAADAVFTVVFELLTRVQLLPGSVAGILLVALPAATGPIPAFFVAVKRGGGVVAVLWGAFAGFVAYPVYAWVVLPTIAIALVRHLRGVTSWAKTDREAIDESGERAEELADGSARVPAA